MWESLVLSLCRSCWAAPGNEEKLFCKGSRCGQGPGVGGIATGTGQMRISADIPLRTGHATKQGLTSIHCRAILCRRAASRIRSQGFRRAVKGRSIEIGEPDNVRPENLRAVQNN